MLVTSHKLKHALELIEPAIPRGKISMPITANFLMQGSRVSATNLEIAISAELPEATTGRTAICLPHALVKRFLQHVPDTEMLDITVRGYKTTIKAGRMESTVQGSNPKDFPALTEIAEEGEQSVDGDRLVRSLMSAAPAASTETARPVLQGVCLTFGEPIKVAAGDGFRLMWEDGVGMNITAPNEATSYVIIPKTSISALDTLWRKAIKVPATNGNPFSQLQQPTLDAAAFAVSKRMMKVRIDPTDNKMSLNVGEATLTTQLIAGTFPDFSSLIAEDQSHQVTFDAAEAFRAVRMLSGIAKDGSNILRMKWGEDYIEFSAKGEGAGEMSQSMPATVRGDPSNIAFNVRYLIEYLSGKEGLILLETSTVSSPARLTHSRSANLQLMPMFVEWGDDPEEQASESEWEVEQAVDESPPVESGGEPVVDLEVERATTDAAYEPASDEADIPAATRPQTRRGHKPAK